MYYFDKEMKYRLKPLKRVPAGSGAVLPTEDRWILNINRKKRKQKAKRVVLLLCVGAGKRTCLKKLMRDMNTSSGGSNGGGVPSTIPCPHHHLTSLIITMQFLFFCYNFTLY